MPDGPVRLRRTDPTRVNLADPATVRFWCQELDVGPGDLVDAVRRVGPKVQDVAMALGRPVPTSGADG